MSSWSSLFCAAFGVGLVAMLATADFAAAASVNAAPAAATRNASPFGDDETMQLPGPHFPALGRGRASASALVINILWC